MKNNSFMVKISNFFKRIFHKPSFSNNRSSSNHSKKTSLIDSLKNKEVQKKLLITFFIILIYRVLAAVPLPGVDMSKLFDSAFGNTPLTSFFTIVTGGRLDNPSIVAIGIGGYINASIILQLLTSVIPKLEDLNKEGERGRRIINQYTRILAVPLSVIQSFVIFSIVKNLPSTTGVDAIVDNLTTLDIAAMIIALTTGSMILMWLGELISEYGLGNGISIILVVGILSSLPSLFATDFSFIPADWALVLDGNFHVLLNENFRLLYLILIGIIVIVFFVVFITEAVRKIPIQYARRVHGAQGASKNFLPLKINQAGVMPVIFSSALLSFPQIIAQLLVSSAGTDTWLYSFGTKINESFLVTGFSGSTSDFVWHQSVYVVLIIAFSFFYTFVTYKPSETSDNLKKSGGFIPGLRPGKSTEKFITKVLLRLAFLGSMFLAVIALLPSIVRLSEQGRNLMVLTGIGGTSLLIVIGVVLDTIRQMKSLTVTNSYDQYR